MSKNFGKNYIIILQAKHDLELIYFIFWAHISCKNGPRQKLSKMRQNVVFLHRNTTVLFGAHESITITLND